MDRTLAVLVHMPFALKAAVTREARRRGKSINDLVVGVLAKEYGLNVKPSNRSGQRALARNSAVVVRMPSAMKRAVQLEAIDAGTNMTDVIQRKLATALGVTLRTAPVSRSPFGGGRRRVN
jgi:hypothetical protein